MKTIKHLIAFIKAVAEDSRIPDRDKRVLLILLALIASPIDIIPDWIPIFGMLDDIVIIAIVMDYLFNQLDQEILLSHYPWGMKSYLRIRRVARVIATLTPNMIKERIWKYKPSVY
jgi:uncharacterized membrane protein YkvA (DUF1232 family)